MKTTIALSVLLLGWTLTTAAADELVPPALDNLRQPQANRIASGAIDAADVGRLRAAGIKHVINLRTAEESRGFHEAQIAAGLGIEYHSLPIAGGQSLTRENAQKLDELLKQAGDEPLLIHCGSGNRVGALIAVHEAWINGKSTELAVAEGKRWGLTSLESAVRTALQEKAEPQ